MFHSKRQCRYRAGVSCSSAGVSAHGQAHHAATRAVIASPWPSAGMRATSDEDNTIIYNRNQTACFKCLKATFEWLRVEQKYIYMI